jgi:hypothetical protein
MLEDRTIGIPFGLAHQIDDPRAIAAVPELLPASASPTSRKKTCWKNLIK